MEKGKERGGEMKGKNGGIRKGKAERRRRETGNLLPRRCPCLRLEPRQALHKLSVALIPPISGIKCYISEKRATRQIAVPWTLGERCPCAKLRA